MVTNAGLVVVSSHFTGPAGTRSLRRPRDLLDFLHAENCRVALIDVAGLGPQDERQFDGLDAMALFRDYLPRVGILALTPGTTAYVHHVSEARSRLGVLGAISYGAAADDRLARYVAETAAGRSLWDPEAGGSPAPVPLCATLLRSRQVRRLVLGRMLGLNWAEMDRRWGGKHRRVWQDVRSHLRASDVALPPNPGLPELAAWVGSVRPYLMSFFRRHFPAPNADAAERAAVLEVLGLGSGEPDAVLAH
ncbi:MAG TPA: hypothetical protein VFI47_04510 [Acidimicrobiales bacterium]|nr:hypothetical protein [Acidimicrobiales bacterium]